MTTLMKEILATSFVLFCMGAPGLLFGNPQAKTSAAPSTMNPIRLQTRLEEPKNSLPDFDFIDEATLKFIQ